ncbi:MAG: hypothetical protein JW749_11965 [Sedimentisphaerales bacterium]|nr:hypothetical protein [Sedimentisphaerales bacterium]
MNARMRKIAVFIVVAILPAGVCKAGDVNQPDPNEIKLLTDVYAGIGIAGTKGGDYGLQTTRKMHFDIMNVQEWFLHLGFEEISLYDYSPSQMFHVIGYISGGFETDKGRFSLFWDHTCHNPVRQFPENKKNVIRWNELGIGYETTGMRFGHENDGIDFDNSSEWLRQLNWKASLANVWMRHKNDYDYMFKFGIRDDFLRIRNNIFYVQFKLDTIYDDRGTNFNYFVEAGDRMLLTRNISFVPFVSYESYNDWYGMDDGEDFFFYGLRLEAALEADSSLKNVFEENKSQREPVFSSAEPTFRFNVSAGYNTNLQGTHKDSRSSDVFFDLDILKFGDDKVLTLNTYAGIHTPTGAFNIRSVVYKIGPSLKIDLDEYYLRFLHTYSCLYGYEHSGVIRNYNFLGAEIGKDAQLSWNFGAGVFPTTTRFDYDALLRATLGYDFSTDGITPYINSSLIYLIGDDSVTGNALEGGLKIPSRDGSFIVYLRQENSFDVFRFGKGEQRWLGLRLVF